MRTQHRPRCHVRPAGQQDTAGRRSRCRRQAEETRGITHTATAPPGLTGYYVPPTIITGASPSDTADEIFGPVLTLHPAPSDTDALLLANTRIGGLAAYVFTTDMAAGLRHGEQLVAGKVKINGTSMLDMHPQSAQSFWAGSGIGGHGNADLLRFFLGTRIVGADAPDAAL